MKGMTVYLGSSMRASSQVNAPNAAVTSSSSLLIEADPFTITILVSLVEQMTVRLYSNEPKGRKE